MWFNRIEKAAEAQLRKFGDNKAKGMVVRKLSGASKRLFQNLFRQTPQLRSISIGGAALGLGLIYVAATLFDRLKAIAQKPFSFVHHNFDAAARGWKRHQRIQDDILSRRFWPVYALAVVSRDVKPPYDDQESFLDLARRALDADISLLEGRNRDGQGARIPFRQAQKLFATPPLSIQKNSVNDLRFSFYRNVRDRHLGYKRVIKDFTDSVAFENVLLIGFRRDLLTLIARGLARVRSGVRIEDLVGTADPHLLGREAAEDRDRILAYVGRKLGCRRRPPNERIYFALEDGLRNVVQETLRSDPEYSTGEALVLDGRQCSVTPIDCGLLRDLEWLLEHFGPVKRAHSFDREVLNRKVAGIRSETAELLEFIRKTPEMSDVILDTGDLRAVRVALAMDDGLRRRLREGRDRAATDRLVRKFVQVVEKQADYDRALIELRAVYQACVADIELTQRFVDENFVTHADKHPEADFDPIYVRYLPRVFVRIREGYRRLKQRLQRF